MTRVLVEECLCLDVAVLMQRGPLEPGWGGTYYFYRNGEEVDSAPWVMGDDGCVCFSFIRPSRIAFPTFYRYWVLVSYTPTEFKGKRAWFACPGCNERVAKLYRPPGSEEFNCRQCHRLIYASQKRPSRRREKAMDRAWAAAQLERIRRQGDAEALAEEPDLLKAAIEHERSLTQVFQHMLGRGELPPEPPGEGKRRYRRRRPFLQDERKKPGQSLCMRCRGFREIEDPQPITLSNGRFALRGHCPVCGAAMTAMIKSR
jgi:hypothetical protein